MCIKSIFLSTFAITCCYCYGNYEIFQGFDDIQSKNALVSINTNLTAGSGVISTSSTLSEGTTDPVLSNITSGDITFNCSEVEKPSNIGPYEIPTQRDLILFIKNTLIRMFNSYHEKALYLLKDIKQASRATTEVEIKCPGTINKVLYRKCVKRVSSKCEVVTKSLVTALERQKEDVSAFIKGSICKMSDVNANPIKLVEILAMEEASLDFALPGYLRLLHKCSAICSNSQLLQNNRKLRRRMTDLDLVIHHFLTKKNYIQLVNGTK